MPGKRRVLFRKRLKVLAWSLLRGFHGEFWGIEYRPLDRAREEIRLISVLPLAPGEDEDSTVRCEIGHFSLEEITPDYRQFIASEGHDAPLPRLRVHWKEAHPDGEDRFTWGDYAALSYTWGDPRILRTLIVNGRTVKVRENLEAALRMWRWRTRSQGSSKLMLWVDALCINQTDKGEREQEVHRMFQIYGQALDVIIWIGPEADNSDLAIDLLDLICGLSDDGDDSPEMCSKTLRETLEQDVGYLSRIPGAWSALVQLLERPYFTRLWIVQEIAMGDPASPCICGRREMAWSWLRCGLETLARHMSYLQRIGTLATEMHASHLEDTQSRFFYIIFNLETPKPESGYEPHRQGIPVLKGQLAHVADVSDDRDRLYGLLNIMEPKVAALVKPDYTSPASTAYIEFSRRYIQHRGDLLSLGWVAPKDGFPSWAINWTANEDVSDDADMWENYRACGNLVHTAPIQASSRILACEALLVDSVDGLGATSTDDVIVKASSQEMAYATAEDRFDAFFANLTAGNTSDSDIIRRDLVMPSIWDADELQDDLQHTPERILDTEQLLKEFLAKCFMNCTFQMAGMDFKSYFDANRSDRSPLTCKESINMFCDATDMFRLSARIGAINSSPFVYTNKRLMTTRRGFFGWTPESCVWGRNDTDTENVRQGDLIAIMAGCRVPLVLRPKGQHYRILGWCYVQGMMHGEYLSLLEKGEIQLQSITIC